MSTYTEDHLVEQPAIQLMQHELGWDVVNCYDEWNGGVSNQGRDGKREVVLVSRLRPVLQRLNPDLPVEAIEGAVEERGILNFECWILNGRGGRKKTPRSNPLLPALSLAGANREIDKDRWPAGLVLFAPEPERHCNRLIMNEFLFEWKTSVAVSPLGETGCFSEMPVHKFMIPMFSRLRESADIVKSIRFSSCGIPVSRLFGFHEDNN